MTRSPEAPLLFEAGRSSPSPPVYAEHFGFARAPFDAVSDVRSLYAGRSYIRTHGELLEGLKRREGLVVLTGESGTGKTTLYRAVINALNAPTFLSEVVNPFLTPDDLLKQVLIDFGVLPSDLSRADNLAGLSGHDLLLMVRRFLEALPAGARALVVIDDAHQVQPRVLAQLRALTNTQTSAGKSLQILLVGQPGLEALLQHPDVRQLNERVARRCRLDRLTPNDVLPYIEHRLAAANTPRALLGDASTDSTDAQPVDPGPPHVLIRHAALTRLASLSRGVPRDVNLLCDRALDVAFERGTHEINAAIVTESARRLGVRVPLIARLYTRTAALLLVLSVLAAISAALLVAERGAWTPRLRRWSETARRFAARPPAPTVPAPAPAEPSRPQPPRAASQPPNVEVLPTADSFAILVASFKGAWNANDTVAALNELDLPAFARADGAWHVVLVGPYVTAAEANEALERIPRRRFPDAHVQKQSATAASER